MDDLLLEDSSELLLEDGFNILLDTYSGKVYNNGVYGGSDYSRTKASVILSVDTDIPTLQLVEKVEGVFQESSIEYSSSSNTYNTGTWGGMDYPRPALSTLNIDTIKPVLDTVSKF